MRDDQSPRCTRRELLAAAGLAAVAGAAEPPSVRRPNLLYVFADQLGLRHCGYAGAAAARTPRIDRFAAQSLDFRQMTAASPVCAAYRATLMTGLNTTSHGMVINELRLRTDHDCLGHALARAGYRTGYIGKWHLYANELGNHFDPKNSFVPPGPDRLGFDGFWAAYNFHHDYYGTYYHRDTPEKVFYGEGVYEPDAQTDMALDFIARGGEAPWSLILSWGPPHDPWGDGNVPAAERELFADVALPNPPNYLERNDPYADDWGRLAPEGRARLETWRRNYYAQTASLDRNLGRLLDALEAAGQAQDTIVVFTSDHGEMFGAHGRRAKNIFYEEACRVPFLLRWPGRVAPGRSEVLLSSTDLMPTLLGLLDLPIPAAAEGLNLAPVARGESTAGPEAVLMQGTGAVAAWQDGFEWRALRDGRYTYARYRRDGSELLFDHQADPYQMTDLTADPAHAPALRRLRDQLADRMSDIQDTFAPCSWYRDAWTEDRIIRRGARG